MAETHHREHPNYMAIFWWLLALTIAEIGIIYVPVGKVAIAAMLIMFAVAKATLVAMYFMHLRFEKATLAVIALSPMVLCVFLLLMLSPDLSAVVHRTTKTTAAASSH